MFRETIVASATAAIVGLAAMGIFSSPASAYHGDGVGSYEHQRLSLKLRPRSRALFSICELERPA